MPSECCLDVFLRGQHIHSISLAEHRLTVGRDPSNDLVLAHPKVSKHHATIQWDKSRLLLSDLGSAQGTLKNGAPIQTTSTIAMGDTIQVGPYVLRIVARPRESADHEPSPPSESGARSLPAHAIGSGPLVGELRGELSRLFDPAGFLGVTDLEAVLAALLDQVMRLMTAQCGFVVLVHGGALSPVIARRGPHESANERFSHTLCQRAVVSREPVLLTSADNPGDLKTIQSLVTVSPAAVLAIPLLDGQDVLGVLYLETAVVPVAVFRAELSVLTEVSILGGKALRTALDRRQIVREKERWQWLATETADLLDMARSCVSRRMQEVLSIVQRVAGEDVTALILGESGTGKEVTARTIHRLSPRHGGPFIAVNCGAIPRDLMEAELFGFESGAFTGATARKLGRLELAQGGTLLLDEVGDLPKELQVKLLRVLEERSFERIGGKETIRWDVRLLAATNLNLEEAVARGLIREDFYYRINVVSIRLPPLRERMEDFDHLVSDTLLLINRRFRRKLLGVTPEALTALRAYRWPGNIRELRNVIERAFILESLDRVTTASLPFGLSGGVTPASPPSSPPRLERQPVLTLAEYMGRQELEYVRLVLDACGGNVTRTAKALGLDRSGLHKKMKHLGIPPGAGRGEGSVR